MKIKINTTKLKEELYKFLLNELYDLPDLPNCKKCKHSDIILSKNRKCNTCKNESNFQFNTNYDADLKRMVKDIIKIVKEYGK